MNRTQVTKNIRFNTFEGWRNQCRLIHFTMLKNPFPKLDSFPYISLADMDDVALMKRVDTKFILSRSKLNSILKELASDYSILEINHERLMHYHTRYFDTNERQFYFDHHNRRAKRTKIRIRTYTASNLHFLEIKRKNVKGQTNKTRIRVAANETQLSQAASAFIAQSDINHLNLSATLENSFDRFTLVNTARTERVTIDLNLTYNERTFNDDLVIIELKQKRYNRMSPLAQALKRHRIYPGSISKYCMGVAFLNPNFKQNNFKTKFRSINKITST
ncbi:MAG: hypothetical protein ACI8ZN_002524 [Bacteroidia bacterium]|jgi:hypothetical protein